MLGVNALLARNAALALVDPAFKKVVDSAVTERGLLLPPPPLSSGLGVNALRARNPEDSGGGGNSGPRSVTALSTTFLKAGSTSASAALRASNAFTPNPEDSGGGGNSGPRSVTALSTTFLKAGSTSASAALRASNAFTPSI